MQVKEVTDGEALRERAVEQHLKALRSGKGSLMISPRHEEARKVAAIVRQQLKAQGAMGAEDHAVKVLRRLDLGPEACLDLLHYAPGRVIGFHTRTAGGFRPGEKWTVETRDKAALRQSIMYPGERKSVWELVQALRSSKPQSSNRMMPDLWATPKRK
jgi:hypothetical protein